jgi:hypothetical protein
LDSPRINLLRLVASLAALLISAVAGAADLRFIEVDRDTERNEYRLKSISWFDADAESLYEVLTDYDQFYKFSSAIVESRNLEPDAEGRPEYFTRMEGCVLMFCKSFLRIGHLKTEPLVWIEAITDPERSDFHRAWERWELKPEDGGTVLIYEFEMIPDFWVPPVIGPYYMKRALRSGGASAVDRIEALAKGEEPPP